MRKKKKIIYYVKAILLLLLVLLAVKKINKIKVFLRFSDADRVILPEIV